MDHYEVRTYPGWHHHRLTTMLAHCFLWHLKLHLGEKSSSSHRVATADVLGGGAPFTDLYRWRSLDVSCAGAAAQLSGLSFP